MATYKYPMKPPVPGGGGDTEDPRTLATDYLYLHRHSLVLGGQNAKDNYFYSRQKLSGGPSKVSYNSDACYIALPGNIQTSYGPAYRRMDIGGSGVALAEIMGSGTSMSALAEDLENAAQVALPEFSTATAVNMANSFNTFLGLSGNIDINAIEQMNHGKIFNPFSEQLFAGVSFRTHNFAFKMLARNDKEAENIFKIIAYIKEGSMPEISGGDFPDRLVNKNKNYEKANPKQNKKGKEIDYKDLLYKRKKTDVFDADGVFKRMNKSNYATSDRYMNLPDRFDLRFVRFNPAKGFRPTKGVRSGAPDDLMRDREDLHFKIFPSVCTGVQVNYTPDSTYIARKRVESQEINVPAVVVSASFVETRLLTKQDTQRGY